MLYLAKMDMRLEELSGGHLAWFYLRPHLISWDTALEVIAEAGYQVTDERQCVMDELVGACVRYLCLRGG